MHGEERRKHIRVFLSGGQVRIISGPILALLGRMLDISIGGMKFQSETELVANEVLSLEILLPDGQKFTCSGMIIHTQHTAAGELIYGLRFVNLSNTAKSMLGEFVMKARAEQDGIIRRELDE
jgi:c-di-GMP-binding flagellar brake protein YcgR